MEDCELIVAINRTVADPLRNYFVFHTISTCIIVVLSFAAWFPRRQDPYLRHRDVWLLFISSIGLIMEVFTVTLFRVIKEPVPCLSYSVAQSLMFPTQVWPVTVRLFLWRSRIRLNYAIASEVAENGLYAMDTKSRSLMKARFLASRRFGFILTFGVLGVYFQFALLFSLYYTCEICDDSKTRETINISYLASAVLFIGAAAFLLHWYRDVPDPIGIRRESAITWTASAIIGVIALVFHLVDLGGFRQEEPVSFGWQTLIDLSLVLFFVLTVPVQVCLSYFKENIASREEDNLEETLKKKTGYKYFQLYLATEFSIENLLFFKACSDWKASYSEQSHSTMENGRYIIDKFFSVGSTLELNLSHEMRRAILSHRHKSVIPEDVFKGAEGVIYWFLEQSYERFRKSDFYKLYTGQMNQDERSGSVTSTGRSFFAVHEREVDAGILL